MRGHTLLNYHLTHILQYAHDSRCSSIGIVTRLLAGRPGVDSRQEQRDFTFASGSEAHTDSYPMGTGDTYAG
jgi:hypothetical protein